MTKFKLALAALLAPALMGGCATRGDLRELHYELRELAVRQDSAFAAMQRALAAGGAEAVDSVGRIADQLFDLRGELNNRLQGIQQQQLVMGELVGQSQHSLALMTEELNRQRLQIDEVSRRQPGGFDGGGGGRRPRARRRHPRSDAGSGGGGLQLAA